MKIKPELTSSFELEVLKAAYLKSVMTLWNTSEVGTATNIDFIYFTPLSINIIPLRN